MDEEEVGGEEKGGREAGSGVPHKSSLLLHLQAAEDEGIWTQPLLQQEAENHVSLLSDGCRWQKCGGLAAGEEEGGGEAVRGVKPQGVNGWTSLEPQGVEGWVIYNVKGGASLNSSQNFTTLQSLFSPEGAHSSSESVQKLTQNAAAHQG